MSGPSATASPAEGNPARVLGRGSMLLMTKKQLHWIILLLLGVFSLPLVARADGKLHEQEGVVVVRSAVLRWEPFKDSQLYATAERGQHFRIYGEKNGYYLTMVTDNDPTRTFNKWIPDWMLRIVPLSRRGLIPTVHRVSSKHLGHVPAPTSSTRQTYRLSPALDYNERVSIAETQNAWYKVKECGGCVHFHDAAVISGQFGAEVAIDGAIFKPTSKPIEVTFLVTVWDVTGKILARDNVSVFGVNADGGSYALTGPLIIEGGASAAYCSIKYQNAWTRK